MRYLRLIRSFMHASFQDELAYRANFWISLLHSCLNLATGAIGLVVLFGQVDQVKGWDLPATLGLLGVYLVLAALRGLFFGPSLDTLAGMDGEVWTGRFDFTLLRPVDVQFQASVRHWRPLALIDLSLGIGVIILAVAEMGANLSVLRIVVFLVSLAAGLTILYAILLTFAGLVFWNPGFLFTWVFDGVFQMARYPVSLYPQGLRFILTWIIPVGVMTTIPAGALTGQSSTGYILGAVGMAVIAFVVATGIFRTGLKRYASASS